MVLALPTSDEALRIEALRQYAVLNTPPDRELDDLAALAAHLCGAPIALISLVDEQRQWFKARIGLEMTETPRDISFCGHAVHQRDLFIVPDAAKDERFAQNPLVTGEPHIRFYAGAPLVSREDMALGTLCVIDHTPRTLTPHQEQALRVLARQVMSHLERRRQARELAESEERLRLVTDNARVGLVIVNRDHRYVYANKAYAELFDLPSSAIVGLRVRDVLLSVYEEQIGPRLARAFAGECVAYELAKPTANGDCHYEVRYEPTSLNGSVELVLVVVTDITERKQAEVASVRLAAIVASSDDAIIGKDLNGVITDWNTGAEKIFGYTAKEMVGTSILRLIPADRHHEEKHILGKIKNGESVEHFETLRQTKDQRLIAVSVTASPIKDRTGKIIGVSKVARDITLQKAAQEQIAEQAALLDKARDAILVRDLEGKILFWNNGAERIYGWTRQEVVGRTVHEVLYADSKAFDEVNSMVIGRGEWHGELQHLTRDKREISIEARWTLIRDSEGRPKSVLAINTDVTERKKLEAQYLRAQRMESIGTLAGGIAHDLNNVLAPIIMSIDILKMKSDDPQATRILETIEISAKRGADIVRQVLTFARGVEGERIEVQPKHLLKDLEKILKDTFPKDVRLQFAVPKETWTILADATQVHQILLNLCVNARDAMPRGGSLTVGVENCAIDEQYAAMHLDARAGRYVKITVTDSGMGIPRELLDRIFEPFFTTKELNKGTGLGLSTVMAIVKSHAGFVNVYSEPGRGTSFTVYLPALEGSGETRTLRTEKVSVPRGNDELVLVVDDETSVLSVTSQTLQAFGYRVLTATDGADALSAYVQHRNEISVVLTDMMMPIMDGAATIQALKRINPAVKIIAVSGLNTNGAALKANGAEIKYFLTKPYTAETLLKAIRSILDET